MDEIGDECFSECLKLQDIELPSGLKSVNYRCFYNCSQLKAVVIPEGVEKISIQAFLKCHRLKRVHLASTVTEVYKGAFQYCKQLDVVEAPEKLCLYSESEAFVDEIRNGLGVRRDAPGQTRYPMIIRY